MGIAEPQQARDDTVRSGDGISEADSVRARMLFLVSQNNAILTQTQFTDAKAGALMTVLLLISIKGTAQGVAAIRDPVDLLSMALVIVSIGFCLAAIMPRVIGKAAQKPGRHNRYTWLSMANAAYSGEEHGEFARQGEMGALLNSVAASNVGASRVLARKIAMLRWGFFTGFAACALLLLAANT